MKFQTTTIAGSGRGTSLGFPMVTMSIPDTLPLVLQQGVYAVRARILEEKYIGTLYYGPASTFGESEPSLEIHLLDTVGLYVGSNTPIEVEILKFIRPIIKFDLPELLVEQMHSDVQATRMAVVQ